jgi:hypothetical protein
LICCTFFGSLSMHQSCSQTVCKPHTPKSPLDI